MRRTAAGALVLAGALALTACAPSGPLTQEEANRIGHPVSWAVRECGDTIKRDGEVRRDEDYVFVGQTRHWGAVYSIEKIDGDFAQIYVRQNARVDPVTFETHRSEVITSVDCGDGPRTVV